MTTRGVADERLFRGSLTPSSEVLVQELPDEELIFLDLRSEAYFGLDPVGTRMYRAVVESASLQEAFERLRDRFDVEPARLRADLRAFVDRLADRGLLEFRE